MSDSQLRLLRRTLEGLHDQLQDFGDRTDVPEVSDQYNQLRTKCCAYADEALLPPRVKGGYSKAVRIPQLLAYVTQLQTLMDVAARELRGASSEGPIASPPSGKALKRPDGLGARMWHLLNQNLVSQVVGGLILAGILALMGAGWFLLTRSDESARPVGQTVAPSQKGIVDDAPAPTVTFADGKRAVVEFAIVTRVLDSDAAKVVAYGGSRETVAASLEPPTESAVHAVLGRYTFDEAQRSRIELERSLLDELRPRYKAVGLTLDSVSLKGFRLITPTPNK